MEVPMMVPGSPEGGVVAPAAEGHGGGLPRLAVPGGGGTGGEGGLHSRHAGHNTLLGDHREEKGDH